MATLASIKSTLCGLLLGALLAFSSVAAPPTITLTGGEKFLDSSYGRWLGKVYKEAFRRLGYDFVLVGYPSQRAILMGDRGEVDGQVERGYDFNVEHPNLIRVEEPTNKVAYSAFAVRLGLKLQGWESMRGKPYRVVSRRGIGKTVERLSLMVPKEQLVYVESPEQALQMLVLSRADIYIDYEPLVEETLLGLRKSEPKTFGDIYKAGEMDYTTHHAFLHFRHAELAKQLAVVLRAMKREGLFEKYRE